MACISPVMVQDPKEVLEFIRNIGFPDCLEVLAWLQSIVQVVMVCNVMVGRGNYKDTIGCQSPHHLILVVRIIINSQIIDHLLHIQREGDGESLKIPILLGAKASNSHGVFIL